MFTAEELKAYVEANPRLVTRRESARYPGLFVIKYHRRVFFDGLWNDILEECRGLVVDADYNAVIRPFTKVFNRFERNTNIHRDAEVLAVRKVNGFMAAVTHVRGHGVVVSTTGSLDSEFADLARNNLPETVDEFADSGLTWLFEIVDPSDPHIIPEEAGAYLIGARPILDRQDYYSTAIYETFLDAKAEQMKVKRPEWKVYERFSDLTDLMNDCRHEGYVVYGDNTALKIKSPFYLVKKLFARMNSDKLLKLIDNDQVIRERVQEEFYPLVDFLREHKAEFAALDEQARLEFIRNYFERTNVQPLLHF